MIQIFHETIYHKQASEPEVAPLYEGCMGVLGCQETVEMTARDASHDEIRLVESAWVLRSRHTRRFSPELFKNEGPSWC